MKRFQIQTSTGNCEIVYNESVKNLKNYLNNESPIVITDRNVGRLYGHLFSDYEVIEIGCGERIKNLRTIENIYQRFLELERDRSSFVLGIGGGVVCDIAGFSASTYMRGLRFGFVPSTLLAQVDASIGGKNGVNFKGYKNIVGVFNQPEFIFLDFDFLKTLPKKELLSGLSEVIKHALIANPSLFSFLEKEWPALISLHDQAIEKGVVESIMIKSQIVQTDAKEKGERKKLNFGHTLGHAIEKASGLPHGEAVSIGMVFASEISARKGLLSAKDAGRINILLQNLGLPTQIPVSKELLIDAVKKDKKRQREDIFFILLSKIGEAKIEKMPYEELEGYINDLC